MSDLISRQAAIDAVNSRKTAEQCKEGEVRNWTVDACVDIIKKLPSAEPKREKWVDDGDPLMLTCGNCGYGVMRYNNTPYCPNCGAKMEGEQ